MPLSPYGQFGLACRAAVLSLALASCGRLRPQVTPGEPPVPSAPVAACAHLHAAADAALATPPDPITGTDSRHHAYAAAMAQYHACLAGRPSARINR